MDTAYLQLLLSLVSTAEVQGIEIHISQRSEAMEKHPDRLRRTFRKRGGRCVMSKSILIVDDANTIRQLLSMTLRNAGCDVVEACDGQDGLTKLKGTSVNMIFTDLNMPVMNGIEFIKAVKSQPQFKFVPIVMLTTESEESKKREGQAAGAKAWIIKPFRPEQIVAVMKKIIG